MFLKRRHVKGKYFVQINLSHDIMTNYKQKQVTSGQNTRYSWKLHVYWQPYRTSGSDDNHTKTWCTHVHRKHGSADNHTEHRVQLTTICILINLVSTYMTRSRHQSMQKFKLNKIINKTFSFLIFFNISKTNIGMFEPIYLKFRPAAISLSNSVKPLFSLFNLEHKNTNSPVSKGPWCICTLY